jgi:hypothetical protein
MDAAQLRAKYTYDPVGAFRNARGEVVGLVSKGYRQLPINGKGYYVHRLVWLWHHGEWPQGEIDHIDRNPANNRIENLRVVDSSGNKQNMVHVHSGTGFRGVTFDKATGQYKAQIQHRGRNYHLGRFDSVPEAAQAYQTARERMHQFAPSAT